MYAYYIRYGLVIYSIIKIGQIIRKASKQTPTMANGSFQICIQILSGKREILQCCQSAICQHQCDPKKCCSFFCGRVYAHILHL